MRLGKWVYEFLAFIVEGGKETGLRVLLGYPTLISGIRTHISGTSKFSLFSVCIFHNHRQFKVVSPEQIFS